MPLNGRLPPPSLGASTVGAESSTDTLAASREISANVFFGGDLLELKDPAASVEGVNDVP